jgi:hypothetical protein
MDIENGVVTVNDLRRRDGHPEVEGGDEVLVASNLVPLNSLLSKVSLQGLSTQSQLETATTTEKINDTKLARWKRHDRLIELLTEAAERDIVKAFRKIQQHVEVGVRNRHKDAEETTGISVQDVVRILFEQIRPHVLRAILAGHRQFVREHRLNNIVWVPNDPEVTRGIQLIARKTVTVARNLLRALAETINEGIAQREDVEQLARRVSQFFDNEVDFRARRIARTNANYGVNAGNKIAATKAGFTHKVWLTMRDDRVRDGHEPLDGEEKPIDGKFRDAYTGELLEFPGDPRATDGASVINCRCTLLYMTKKERD